MNTILCFIPTKSTAKKRILEQVIDALNIHSVFNVEICQHVKNASTFLEINPRICAVLYDYDEGGLELCQYMQTENQDLPIFAFTSNQTDLEVDLETLKLNLHFVSYKADQASIMVDRIKHEIEEYIKELIPPFTKALFDYAGKNIYSYCTPGHAGGTAFLQSPVGALFYDFYGPNIFKSDLSISMTELGTLLDHSGKHRDAEEYIANQYGSDHCYIVTNGTSTSNKIIGMHVLYEGATILLDRNCHKSLTHLLMMSKVTPIYLQPARNHYGIMGGTSKDQFTYESIEGKRAKLSLQRNEELPFPHYAVLTNSTYDGFLYRTDYVKNILPIKNIHFDGAWIAYAPFSEIYHNHYGMSGEAPEGKTIYEAFSTHKLLAAFSQSATIHIKGQQFDADSFNDSFMMHTSTSPFYPIVASTETAAAMMRGKHGHKLIQQALKESCKFRKEVERLRKENDSKAQGWFYDILQPESISQEIRCFPVTATENWHGFDGEKMDHMSLDPIKVTLLTPGLNADGSYDDFGIPACLIAKFLNFQNIIVEKTGPYSLLFLFGIGSDRSKSLKLLNELSSFKKRFDENYKIEKIIPNLYQEAPKFYREYRIQELAQAIHQLYIENHLCEKMDEAYELIPHMAMTPYEARQHVIKEEVVKTPLQELKGKVASEMILPYPPGIPLLLPGETITNESLSIIKFLETLCKIGDLYPGFETSIHGLNYSKSIGYYTYTIKT
jgi:lysine decarboxylase